MERQLGRVPGKWVAKKCQNIFFHSKNFRDVGYCGYIPGVKAENVFGESYGKSSKQSSKGEIIRGFDQDPQEKYKSVA